MSKRDILDRLAGTPVLRCGRKKDGCQRAHLLWSRGTETIMPPHQAFELLIRDGWQLNTNPALDRCPDCIKTGYTAEVEDEPEPAPETLVPTAPPVVPEPVIAAVVTAITDHERINQIFSDLSELSSLDWTSNENMFLAAITIMISHVETFITKHYKSVSLLNRIALLQASENLLYALARQTGSFGPILQQIASKDEEIIRLNKQLTQKIDGLKNLRLEYGELFAKHEKITAAFQAKCDELVAIHKNRHEDAHERRVRWDKLIEAESKTPATPVPIAANDSHAQPKDDIDRYLESLG